MLWKLPLATVLIYTFRIDEWVLYYFALTKYYYDIVTAVVDMCGAGCHVPDIAIKLAG